MALKVNAGDAKRGDYWHVPVNELIVNPDNRGRLFAPSLEQVRDLAVSILEDEQLQAINVTRDIEKRFNVVSGFTRVEAVKEINKGFEYNGKRYHDPELKIKCMLSDCNEEEALRRNIIENNKRNNCSDVDDAHNQNRLRKQQGMNDTEIATFYSCSPTHVGKLSKLLLLSMAEKQLVHEGKLSTQAAIDLLALDKEERARIIEECTKDTGKVDTSAVRSQVRDKHLSEADEAEPKKRISRSIKDLRTYLNSRLEKENMEQYHDIMEVLLGYIAGTKTDIQMDNAFKRVHQRKAA